MSAHNHKKRASKQAAGSNGRFTSHRSGRWTKRDKASGVFVGPSVGGGDKKYVKVISGEVDDRKPSFA